LRPAGAGDQNPACRIGRKDRDDRRQLVFGQTRTRRLSLEGGRERDGPHRCNIRLCRILRNWRMIGAKMRRAPA
jgi:hypothetical protein